MERRYLLKGLNCPNCAAAIEAEAAAVGGVKRSSVNLLKQTITLELEEKQSVRVEAELRRIVKSHEPDVEVIAEEAHLQEEQGHAEEKTLIPRLFVGVALLAVALLSVAVLDAPPVAELGLIVAAYLVLGGDVLLKAAKNVVKGRVFDENLLMSLSTIGAFLIGEYYEAAAVMLFYQVGEYFQDRSVRRSRRSIARLMDIRPDFATVKRDGALFTVSPEDVAAGEEIVVRAGERVPLDGVVTEGTSTLDTKALTGESVPREVAVGGEVLSGCINQSGVLTLRVTRPYGDSTVARIIDMVENAAAKKAPTESFITTFARYYTPAVVAFAALLALLPPLIGGASFTEWVHRALVFLVISCPCALVISIPLAFFGGIGAASKHGVLVKGGNCLEALNKVSTVIFDKTGTLTKGVFTVKEVVAEGDCGRADLLRLAATVERFSTHPIALSILEAYGKEPPTDPEDCKEIAGKGVSSTVEGKRVLAGNAALMEAEGIAYTPCGGAGTKVYLACDGVYAGCILIADEIKKDGKKAVSELKRRGVKRAVMLTGDEAAIAKSVAEELGIDEYRAGLLPHEKVEALDALDKAKPKGTRLAAVGDGINDAPLLARAGVGIAMGGIGSDAAIEAADVVLMTDEPSRLATAVDIARATKRIVVQNIVLALSVKGLFLVLGALGLAGMWEAVFGDVGVALIAVFNSMRILKR